jgi:hypothetical protein
MLSVFKFVSCHLQEAPPFDVVAKLIISPLYLNFPSSLVKRKGKKEEKEKWSTAVCGGPISKCHYHLKRVPRRSMKELNVN